MKKRVLLLLIAALALIMFSGCKWDQPERVPEYEETKVVTDENGTHTETYRRYGLPDERRIDPSFYKFALSAGALFTPISLYFFYRVNEIIRLKKKCTQSVPATVLYISKKRNWDRTVKFRSELYNATYSYTYDGLSYESSSDYYGRSSAIRSKEMKAGDSAEINIDPSQPRRVYDVYAKYILGRFMYPAVVYGLIAVASFVSYFVV